MNNDNIYNAGNNQKMSQKNLDDIYNYFYKSYSKVYDSKQKTDVAHLINTINPMLSSYGTDLANIKQNEFADTRDFNQGESGKGVFNSSGKILRQKSLNAKYNKEYNSQYQQTKQALQNALINYGAQYGSQNTPSFDLGGVGMRGVGDYSNNGLNFANTNETLTGAGGGQINAVDAERRKQAMVEARDVYNAYGENPNKPFNI